MRGIKNLTKEDGFKKFLVIAIVFVLAVVLAWWYGWSHRSVPLTTNQQYEIYLKRDKEGNPVSASERLSDAEATLSSKNLNKSERLQLSENAAFLASGLHQPEKAKKYALVALKLIPNDDYTRKMNAGTIKQLEILAKGISS